MRVLEVGNEKITIERIFNTDYNISIDRKGNPKKGTLSHEKKYVIKLSDGLSYFNDSLKECMESLRAIADAIRGIEDPTLFDEEFGTINVGDRDKDFVDIAKNSGNKKKKITIEPAKHASSQSLLDYFV